MTMVVSHWSANLAALAAYLVVAIAHLIGMRAAATSARRRGQPRPATLAAQAVAFQSGLLIALLAVVSPVGYWSYRLVWARNLQDVALAFVAPVLIVLGAPWLPLARGLGRADWPAAGDGARTAADGEDRRPGWPVPVAITVAFAVGWWVWHLPGPFDAALHSPFIYAAEVVTYLGLGTALWVQLIGSQPLRPRLDPLRRIPLLVGVIAVSTALGVMQAFGPNLMYPAYLSFRHQALKVVSDQQTGGAELWMLPLVPLGVLAVALCIRWLSDDEQTAASAADVGRLLEPRKSAWASRSGLR